MKMRKALSFVLVLALVLGSFSMVFAADVKRGTDFPDIADNANFDAIVANTDLKIIEGFDDGTFKPGDAVNRAQFAAMITRMMGVPESALAGYTSTSFTDMAGYDWANKYIGYCTAKGIMNGNGDGTVAPGRTITPNEAVTMALRAIGYVNNSSELVGSWPANYVSLGKRLGLYDDVSSATTVDRANAAQIIYNSLTATVVAVNADGNTKDAYVDKRWVEVNGTNTQVEYSKTVLEVYLDCTLFGTGLDKDGFAVYPYEAASDSVINTMDYVGAYVKAFANKDGDVVAIAECKSTFLTGKYDYEDEEFEVGDTVYALKASNVNKMRELLVNGAVQKIKDSEKVAANLDKDFTVGGSSQFNGMKMGTVTLAVDVSGQTIKEVYSVNKWIASDAVFFEKDMLEDEELYGYKFELDNAKAIDPNQFALNGATDLDKIAEDSIVEIFLYGYNSNAKIARVDVGTETVEGKVTMIDDDDYTIGGKVYRKADEFADDKDNAPSKAGDTGIAYLSYRGEFAGWELQDAAADNYAVVAKKFKNDPLRDDTIVLFDKNGVEKEYTVKSGAFDINGVTLSGGLTTADGLEVGSLVTFSLDKNGKIKELKAMALWDASEAVSNKEVNKNRTVFANTRLDDGVVIFTYDKTTVAASDFTVIKLSDLEAEKELVNTYYYADDGKIKAMMVQKKYTGAESIYAVINKVKAAVNDDDDDVLYIEGYANGKKFTKYTTDDSYPGTGIATTFVPTEYDVFELTLNSNGDITDIERVTVAVPANSKREATIEGTIADKSGNYLIQVSPIGGAPKVWLTLDPSVAVYTFDTAANKLEFSDSKVGDIYKTGGGKTASDVIVFQADDDSEVYDIVIIVK